MVTHEIILSFAVTPARVRLALLLALCTLLPVGSSGDDISTFDFYYPPPVAAIDRLQVQGQTVLARDFGNVYLGAANASGDSRTRPPAYVAIGTLRTGGDTLPNSKFPAAHLYVKGTMNVDGCISLVGGVAQGGLDVWRCKFKSSDP